MKLEDIFDTLFEVLEERKKESKDISYVASLYAGGIDKINSKIDEESKEMIEAAIGDDKKHLINEVCDLLFHTFVLCKYKNVEIDDIRNELSRRFGLSGIEEKKNRTKQK